MSKAKRTVMLGVAGLLVMLATGCAPEVGSEQWCQSMKEKPKGNWTANEAGDFAKHCILK